MHSIITCLGLMHMLSTHLFICALPFHKTTSQVPPLGNFSFSLWTKLEIVMYILHTPLHFIHHPPL